MQTNIVTGEEKLTKMCGFQAMPIFLTEVIKASNRPAAAINDMRNNLVKTFENSMPLIIEQQRELLEKIDDDESQTKCIESD